jgi:2-(1,2-epoxy-1,2-dihydrophenyl)acetyl-CoA isomerase
MPALLSDLQDGVLTLTLSRPERANALNLELMSALQNALRLAARDAAVRVVVLTGAGRAFGAGQDLAELRTAGEQLSILEHLRKSYNPLILQLRRIEKPVLAAINGPCAGASLGVALACDIRLAADRASFVVGFNGIGLVPDSAVSILLPALVGLGRAAELAFTNAPFSAAQALEWGLVNQVVSAESLMEETRRWALRLAAGPVAAYGLTKRLFNRAVLPRLEEILEYEGQVQEIAARSPEHREGLAAFLEKRAPNYPPLR